MGSVFAIRIWLLVWTYTFLTALLHTRGDDQIQSRRLYACQANTSNCDPFERWLSSCADSFSSSRLKTRLLRKRTTCNWAPKRFQKCQAAAVSVDNNVCLQHTYSPDKLISLLENRTLAFVGDSLTWQLSSSIFCSVMSDPNVPRGEITSFSSNRITERDRCVSFTNYARICTFNNGKAIVSGKPGWDPIISKLSARDIMIVNYGVHYNMHDAIHNRTVLRSHCQALAETYALGRHHLPLLLWRETFAQHFPSSNGLFEDRWNRGSPLSRCKAWDVENAKEFSSANWRNMECNLEFRKASVPIIPCFQLSALAGKLHRGGRDCTHFCLPGFLEAIIPLVYNVLFAKLFAEAGETYAV